MTTTTRTRSGHAVRPRRLPRQRLARGRASGGPCTSISRSRRWRELRLQAIGSQSHRAPILEHTAESRTRARQLNPALADVPDERLTHYIEDVDLPSDALQHVWVTGSDADGGAAVAVMHIHVPAAARQAAQQRALAAGGGDRVGRGGPAPASGVLNGGNDYLTPVSTAVSLVFHSPEIMNLNVDQGATILNLIQTLPCTDDPMCTPYLGTLAAQIAEKWPATTSGGWATLVQVIDANGKPVVNEPGQARLPLRSRPRHRAGGVGGSGGRSRRRSSTTRSSSAPTGIRPRASRSARRSAPSGLTGRPAGAAQFALTAAYPAGASVHGVAFDSVSVTNQASRTVQLQFRNAYLRYLSTYVQFANEDDDLPVANPTNRRHQSGEVPGLDQQQLHDPGHSLFGNDIPLSSVQFDVPADASIAKVYFGSLGLGGEAFCPESLDGSILTLIFNIGVPTILLAAGVAATGALLHTLSQEIGVSLVQILRASLPLILGIAGPDIANGIFGTANSGNAVGVLTSLGSALHQRASSPSGEAAALLVQLGGSRRSPASAIDFMGPLALVFRAIAVLADVAMIAQTVGEVLASPALFINAALPDADHHGHHQPRYERLPVSRDGPQIRGHAHLRLRLEGRAQAVRDDRAGARRSHRRRVRRRAVGRHGDRRRVPDHRERLHRRTQHRPGRDDPGPYGPVPGTQASIALTIKELLIPLLQTTQYLHDVKLEYQNGQHVWVETAAPTATIADLGQGQENALYDLNGITISQRTGMAGYAFRAGGQGVPFCGQALSGIEYMVQNVFLADESGSRLEAAAVRLPTGRRHRLRPLGSGDRHRTQLLPAADAGRISSSSRSRSTTPPRSMSKTR